MLPERVSIFRPLLWAVTRRGRGGRELCAYFLLRSATPSGYVGLEDAHALIADCFGVSDRSARRIVQRGAGTYWTSTGSSLLLHNVGRVAVALGAGEPGRPRLVPAEALADHTGLSYAVAVPIVEREERLRLGADGIAASNDVTIHGSPMSRAKVAELTGVSIPTQRRVELRGVVELVQHVHAEVEDLDGVAKPLPVGRGYYIGKGGRPYRQCASLRRAPNHREGARSTGRHANGSYRRALETQSGPASTRCRPQEFNGPGATTTTDTGPRRVSFYSAATATTANEARLACQKANLGSDVSFLAFGRGWRKRWIVRHAAA